MDGVKCLNPWDVQSKHIVTPDGISESICAGEKRWGALPPNVCYEVNMDRLFCAYGVISKGNGETILSKERHMALSCGGGQAGQGYPAVCYETQMDDVIAYDGYNMAVNDKTFMTITSGATDDHHVPSVIYSLEGNGSRPSHQGAGYSADGRMFTLNTIEKHAVCYAIEGNVVDRISLKNGKGWCEDVSPTLNTQDKHAVCYAIENHPCDSRVTVDENGIVQTLNARMGTGGATHQ